MNVTHKVPKDYRRLVAAALAADWRVVHKRKHLQLRSPDGVTIVAVPSTPSDINGVKAFRAQLKRAGVAA